MPKSLPMVQLQLLEPLLTGLTERGLDPEPILESVGLTMSALETEGASVHVMVMHQFVENCADATGDRTFCATIGNRLDPTGWPMIRKALDNSTTLGGFLNIYVANAAKHASSATPFLEVRGEAASFGETRRFKPLIKPAQNDGFMTALKLSMLERVLKDEMVPELVTLILCDPRVLPDHFSRFQLLAGDAMGPRIQFPSEWLSLKVTSEIRQATPSAPLKMSNHEQFLLTFRKLLKQNTGNGGLKAQNAAKLVAMSPKKLSRTLQALGTTTSKEISFAKFEYAKEALANTDQSIEEISLALGFSAPSNFTRAFVKNEGSNPSQFRAATQKL